MHSYLTCGINNLVQDIEGLYLLELKYDECFQDCYLIL